jgi:hypothetical protein
VNRIQLKSMNFSKYPPSDAARLAHRVRAPASGAAMTFESPLPPDMQTPHRPAKAGHDGMIALIFQAQPEAISSPTSRDFC